MRIILNGCFDCLHAGHKHLIDFAIRLAGIHGDVVFLINTSKSVRELKGPSRPIQSFKDRLEGIQGYWLVRKGDYGGNKHMPIMHYKVFDSEQELADLMDIIRPDVIIKGDDRPDTREIVGHGKYPICILPRLKDTDGEAISTTRMLSDDRDNVVREDSTPF